MTFDMDDIIISRSNQFIDCFKNETVENVGRKFICQVSGCGNSYSDKSGAIRHLKKHHTDFYDAIKYNKEDKSVGEISLKSVEIRVKVDVEEIWNACIELVTVHGLPLSVVEFPAFQRILKPYMTSLELKGIGLIINRHNIKDRVAQRADEIRQLIALEAENKVLTLLVDIASRYNRSILGVNIAFMKDDTPCFRTIGMHIIEYSQTAENIKSKIIENLTEYGIRIQQIIAVVSDNGKNITKSIGLMNADFQASRSNEESDDFINHEIFDDEYYTDLLTRACDMFEGAIHHDLVHGVACGAHCLHLVVSHAIQNTENIKNFIEKCRELAKKLRTPTLRTLLKNAGCTMSIIDVKTRWNSIFTMVLSTKLLMLI